MTSVMVKAEEAVLVLVIYVFLLKAAILADKGFIVSLWRSSLTLPSQTSPNGVLGISGSHLRRVAVSEGMQTLHRMATVSKPISLRFNLPYIMPCHIATKQEEVIRRLQVTHKHLDTIVSFLETQPNRTDILKP